MNNPFSLKGVVYSFIFKKSKNLFLHILKVNIFKNIVSKFQNDRSILTLLLRNAKPLLRDAKPLHTHCPAGAESWCKYRKAEATNTLKDYKHPPALSKDVQEVLKPIYDDLTKDELLQRCLGGHTQNNNESFNATVWGMAPKHIFNGKKIVKIATLTAACIFNEGFKPVLKIMDVMGIKIGYTAIEYARLRDRARVLKANRSSLDASKESRAQRRQAKLDENQLQEQSEGILYGTGIAD